MRSKGAVAIADAVRGGLPKLKVPTSPLPSSFQGLGCPVPRVSLGW